MVANFLRGGAAINGRARQMGGRVTVVDAGVASEIAPHPDLVIGKIGWGTADMSVGPAMTAQQAQQAVQLGRAVAAREIERGLDILAVGEMGIGNTTAASAISDAGIGQRAETATRGGTGI